jgi:uncharacterized protein DUF4038/uncharacterized protein DUF5060/collagenase-like protein with putative collagen-binding domain
MPAGCADPFDRVAIAALSVRATWPMRSPRLRPLLLSLLFLSSSAAWAAPRDVTFAQSAESVEAYDFVEVTINVASPDAANPFTDVRVTGKFGKAGGPELAVEGFADALDGSLFRIRFMPESPGNYAYSVNYRQGYFIRTHSGSFRATDGHRRGILRVDAHYPWHFIWEGTGEHYFWNGTTAFLLMAWTDEGIIRAAIDRLHRLKVNRIRLLLAGGRSSSFWSEPIIPDQQFWPYLNPWVAERPSSTDNPGFDYSRFNVEYYQKFERMLRYAREKDMIISVIMDWNDSKVHPSALSDDEFRYYQYSAARLSAFSNLTWDLGDDISLYRSLDWSRQIGTRLEQWDPYHHLATDHPVDNAQQDRTSTWFGFTSFQYWPRPLHGWMLNQRKLQAAAGRIIPQVDEEYGYEDHYPRWSPSYPDGASADANRRAAWEMAMAGTYQTTGETAKHGTGAWPDTGGGWVNGRGDDSMTMLEGYAHMVDFFTSFEWWKADPHDELVEGHAYCLAEPGKLYVLYLAMGEKVSVRLEPGTYHASWFDPRDGRSLPIGDASGPKCTTPEPPDGGDWVVLLKRSN